MNPRLPTHTVTRFLISAVLVATGWSQNGRTADPGTVPLDVYAGVNSLLVVWSAPPDAELSAVTVYRGMNPFEALDYLTDVDPDQDRWLDREVEPAERYFYRVELLTDSDTLFSVLDTPPFSSPLTAPADPPEILPLLDSLGLTAGDSVGLPAVCSALLEQELSRQFADAGAEGFRRILWFLKSGEDEFPEWFSRIPLRDFRAYKLLLTQAYRTRQIHNLDNLLETLEPYLRNEVRLTPLEWTQTVTRWLSALDQRLESLVYSYRIAGSFLDSLDPLRIVDQTLDSSGSILVGCLVLNPEDLENRQASLVLGDTEYPLVIEPGYPAGTRLDFRLPPDRGWIRLHLDERLIQSFPVHSAPAWLICTLDDRYVIGSPRPWDESHLRGTPCTVFLNEIYYTSANRRLALEIAGRPDTRTVYGLFMNDSLWWEFPLELSLESVYLDSVWILDSTFRDPVWIILKTRDSNGTWQDLDHYPLNLDDRVNVARIPDGAEWVVTSFSTLGNPNDVSSPAQNLIPIPEVFALYQNYPNPFNAETTISFDLLQPALVNLFVTDAKGRKVDTFLETVNLTPGTYSYSWDGRKYSSGVYFFTLQAQVGDFLPVSFSRKMIFLK